MAYRCKLNSACECDGCMRCKPIYCDECGRRIADYDEFDDRTLCGHCYRMTVEAYRFEGDDDDTDCD